MQHSIGVRRHLLWGNFWALPCAMILAAVAVTCVLLVIDDRGGALWIEALGWPFAISPSTADTLATGLVTIHAAFSTLYFSITLLVLTLAASNLGVRLIDRWIGDFTIRFTLGLLLSLLSASLILLYAVDTDAPLARVPRVSLTVLAGATILTIAWMSNALHHLGRTVQVDTSIARLGRDAANNLPPKRAGGAAPTGRAQVPILASATGYVGEIASTAMVHAAAARDAYVSLSLTPGDYMIAGEPIGWIAGDPGSAWVTAHIRHVPYRTDSGGAAFEINLLIEVAARALSPGINDFYTALACCDRLGSLLAAAFDQGEDGDWLCDAAGIARLHLPRDRVTVFMDGPLKALRQSAANYPSVAIHMIDLFARACSALAVDQSLRAFVLRHAEAFAQHADARAQTDSDRADIAAALVRVQSAASGTETLPR
ncbi:DUF2254 family protein [Sphingomonas qomolangmaensis]|uniref:DUF2254 domain-containing protein n=1 Tax=Sphingomonas qomolangmaensis TaxID=2918765 RepID=A0ABY5L863_9SPHN|nr:DUF2254 family protein [Sphingomonas qomolangmaensis]UUL83158.1 DUF2254 domain-containing protein [Sphingomonas qomolangmaensis]